MKTRTAVAAMVVVLVFSFNIVYAAWVSLGLPGENIFQVVAINGFFENGHPFLDVLATNQGGSLFVKHGSSWTLAPLSGVSCIIPERDDNNQDAWVINNNNVSIVYSSNIGNAYDCATGITGVGGVIRGEVIYIASSSGNVYSQNIHRRDYWAYRSSFPKVSCFDSTSDRLWLATSYSLYREYMPNIENFKEIMPISNPKKISASKNILYLLDTNGQLLEVSDSAGTGTWEIATAYNSVVDIASDGKFIYLISDNQVIRFRPDEEIEEILPNTGLPSANKNCISLNDSVLYLGTTNGCYAYNLAVAAPTNVTASLSGSNINVSWSASMGASGYKILALNSINEWDEYDVGNTTSSSISATGIVAVKVVAYDSDGYETAIADCAIKDVVDPTDTSSPSWTIDLVAERLFGNPNTIILKWTAPSDNRRVANYKIQYNWHPCGQYATGNVYAYYMWNLYDYCKSHGWPVQNVQQSIVPALPGSEESITITGLTPGTTYHAAMNAVDAKGNQSPISNNVNFIPAAIAAPVYKGARKLVWDASPESEEIDGYRIYYGTSSGIYSNFIEIKNRETTSYDLKNIGITQGSCCYIIVRAYIDDLEGFDSNEVVFCY